jgi:CheY-like chemotaxis protein
MKESRETERASPPAAETLPDKPSPFLLCEIASGQSNEAPREAFWGLLAGRLPGIRWSTDADLRVTSCVGSGLGALRLRPNQLVGVSLFRYFQTDDPEYPPIAVHRRVLRGEAIAYDARWRGRSYQALLEPVRERPGPVTGCRGIAFDLTPETAPSPRLTLAAENARLARLVQLETARRESAEEALRRGEEQLRRARAEESFGPRVGRVAHDLNNLLTVISGYNEMLLLQRRLNDPARPMLEEVRKATAQAAGLAGRLVALVRRQAVPSGGPDPDPGPEESAEADNPSSEPPRGTETVLLVDDEPAVLDLLTRILRLHGYTVLAAGHAPEALDLAQRHPGPVQLLVTDVSLPEMGGAELARRLDRIRPGAKVLYVSGLPCETVFPNGLPGPGTAFLCKPFPHEALVRQVRGLLDHH